MKKLRAGSKVTIKINGKEIETVIDKGGVQRLPSNRIFRYLICDGGSYKKSDGFNLAKFDLNALWIDMHNKKYTKVEVRQLYQNIGYSVCGYAEVFPRDKIENPLWDK